MKKLLFITVLLVATVTQAQDFKIGPKAGVGYGSFTEGDGSDYSNIQIGVQSFIILSPEIAISPEVYYNHYSLDGNALKWNFSYITVPVKFRYFVLPGLNIHAGPEVNFLVSNDYPDLELEPVEMEGVNVAATLGVGYLFDFGLSLDLRYSGGLTSTFANSDTKLSTFNLGVGYLF
ncbi:outer membrane beta-barrel protein [Leeuwenhoekiella aequorea]|uniref:outer membrane beta-barrel protein n=1 Tax=Leeuwenhoekiella aequorea TaxID=283736 RepID=UPI00352F869B|tara:strand:+ start:11517 stop:12044 length:528 start_codon:yes stop_codon:yes gene_type:complete